jgi:hypothetical protein
MNITHEQLVSMLSDAYDEGASSINPCSEELEAFIKSELNLFEHEQEKPSPWFSRGMK